MNSKDKKPSGIMRKIGIVICLIVLIVSGSMAVKDLAWRMKAADENQQLAESVWETEEETETESVTETIPETEPEVASLYSPPPGLADLMASNEHVVGWIKVDGTNINYPIMQDTEDNEYYLYRDIDGKKTHTGSIYLDKIDDLDKSGINILYGHHMRASYGLSMMFREVTNYRKQSYMDEHNDIVVWTDEAEYHYEPFYCYAGKPDSLWRNNLSTQASIDAFLESKIGKTGEADRVLVLITCSYGSNDERTYCVCRLKNMYKK